MKGKIIEELLKQNFSEIDLDSFQIIFDGKELLNENLTIKESSIKEKISLLFLVDILLIVDRKKIEFFKFEKVDSMIEISKFKKKIKKDLKIDLKRFELYLNDIKLEEKNNLDYYMRVNYILNKKSIYLKLYF